MAQSSYPLAFVLGGMRRTSRVVVPKGKWDDVPLQSPPALRSSTPRCQSHTAKKMATEPGNYFVSRHLGIASHCIKVRSVA
jgi:hypothetical protein